MAKRRRKNRTHLKGPAAGEEEDNAPKSFVIKSGEVTKSIAQLVRDMRKVMEPGTASRLRERQSARLRDYLVMAPALKVSHLMIFTLTDAANVHLRVARLPQGPTLTFRVERYSLMKDLVNSSMRNMGKAPGGEYRSPPLLVLNNFQPPAGTAPLPQLKLITTMFQGLFPAIQVEKSALPTFRRVLLLSYHAESHLISLRHYTITVRPHGVSRRVRKILGTSQDAKSASTARSKVNLASAEDIADYLLKRQGSEAGTAYESGSETEASEAESDSNAVELPEDYVGRGNKRGERKAVRLVEVGPRLELRLVKVVEGLVGSKKGEGETVFHEFVNKTKADAQKLQAAHLARRQAKEARRKQQEENVKRKKAAAAKAKKVKVVGPDGAEQEESEDEIDMDDDLDADVDGLSDPEMDMEKYRSEGTGAVDEDEEFAYEDAEFDDTVEAGDVSDSDVEMGDSSADEDEEEVVKKPRPAPTKKARAGKR